MSKPREFWIYKGTSNFCSELQLNDDCETYIKCKTDGFYDVVSICDTIENGVHVIEYSAYKELLEANSNCISLLLHESRMKSLDLKNMKLIEEKNELKAELETLRSKASQYENNMKATIEARDRAEEQNVRLREMCELETVKKLREEKQHLLDAFCSIYSTSKVPDDLCGHQEIARKTLAMIARQALNDECFCGEINIRNCPIHQNQKEE